MIRRAPVLALLLVLVAIPRIAEAQSSGRVYRIGFVSMRSGPEDNVQLDAFRQGLRERGYLEGRNVVLEIRYAAGQEARLPGFAGELARLRMDVIVAQSGVAALAVKKATRTTPIVMASSGDAVRQGLVASLARPGGNVTGLTLLSPELSQKRLEVLREMLPRLSRVGVLWCGGAGPVPDTEWAETRAAAEVLKVKLASLDVPVSRDLAGVFDSATRQGVEAVIMFDCSRLHPSAARITELAMKHRLPAVYPFSLYPETGGLMSYGASLREAAHRAAGYVDRILKGGRPADLPVEQPTKFELVINLRTAKALGLRIPQAVLVRADQVIE